MQIVVVMFTIPLGFGIALTIRIGNLLPLSGHYTKQFTKFCIGISTIFFTILSFGIYVTRHTLFRIFTSDPDILHGCDEIWLYVTIFYFNLSFFCLNLGIATGLGKQGLLGIVCIIYLFGLGLPITYYVTIIIQQQQEGGGDGLVSAWQSMLPPVIVMNLTLFTILMVFTSWDDIATTIRIREGMYKIASHDETETLLSITSPSEHGIDTSNI
jgi:Na+-driven multidrug efflux pump